jgi:hypothetical protein
MRLRDARFRLRQVAVVAMRDRQGLVDRQRAPERLHVGRDGRRRLRERERSGQHRRHRGRAHNA